MAIAHGVVGECPGLASSGGHQDELAAFGRFGDDPLIVGRDGHGVALADAGGRRSIGIAQEDGIVWSAAVAFFFEQDLVAVAADVACNGPAEPSQLTLFFSAR